MPAIPKMPETITEYQSIVEYLLNKTIPIVIEQNSIAISNFKRRCKRFEVDENKILYLPAIIKDDGSIKSQKRHLIPKYDKELQTLILNHFHDQFNHCNYHKTFSALSEKHIGITQEKVQKYINECSSYAINTSIKEKVDMTPVISIAP